jgi:hypothetical protein
MNLTTLTEGSNPQNSGHAPGRHQHSYPWHWSRALSSRSPLRRSPSQFLPVALEQGPLLPDVINIPTLGTGAGPSPSGRHQHSYPWHWSRALSSRSPSTFLPLALERGPRRPVAINSPNRGTAPGPTPAGRDQLSDPCHW